MIVLVCFLVCTCTPHTTQFLVIIFHFIAYLAIWPVCQFNDKIKHVTFYSPFNVQCLPFNFFFGAYFHKIRLKLKLWLHFSLKKQQKKKGKEKNIKSMDFKERQEHFVVMQPQQRPLSMPVYNMYEWQHTFEGPTIAAEIFYLIKQFEKETSASTSFGWLYMARNCLYYYAIGNDIILFHMKTINQKLH